MAWQWDDVRFFLAVARAGSLSGAARALGVGHVTVGRRITLLEKRLGVTLLNRTPDGFATTSAGQAILRECVAMESAALEGMPLGDAEQATMGFTHCETGRALAEKWELADEVIEVIAHHHAVEQSQKVQPLVALVHLSDLLCRMRGLGYGYYERHKVDLIADPAWAILLKEHRELEGVDLVRFTFELDEALEEIETLVATVFRSAPARV